MIYQTNDKFTVINEMINEKLHCGMYVQKAKQMEEIRKLKSFICLVF